MKMNLISISDMARFQDVPPEFILGEIKHAGAML